MKYTFDDKYTNDYDIDYDYNGQYYTKKSTKKVKDSYSPEFVKMYKTDVKEVLKDEELDFPEFLLQLNMTLPEEYQLYEDEISGFRILDQVSKATTGVKKEIFENMLWDIKEELRNDLEPKIEDKIKKDLTNKALLEIERERINFNREKKNYHEKVRREVINSIKNGVDI